MICDKLDFGLTDPDIALGGAGAALATFVALEMQAGGIPKIFIITEIHGIYFTMNED